MTTTNTRRLTNAIMNGKLALTNMGLEEYIEGTIVAVDPEGSAYGPTLNLKLADGQNITVYPSGNVKKFVVPELLSGERPLNTFVRITRRSDKVIRAATGKSYTSSHFSVFQDGYIPPRFREDTSSTEESKTTSLEDVKKQLQSKTV